MKAVLHTKNKTPDLLQPEEVVDAPTKGTKAKRRVTKLRTVGTLLRRGACSTTLITVLDRADGHPLDLEERATEPFAGGLMQGYQCGMLWGASLAAGAQAHRRLGPGPQAEAAAVDAATRLVGSFRACHHHINCLEITETDPRKKWQTFKYFFLKGGTITCARRMARYAPQAHGEITTALAAEPPSVGCNPANCAATLARKMGASELHVTMAAAFAGGIGLSGGACGALGAAIWIQGIKGRTEGASNKVINARISDTVERFQQASDYAFECAEIVGRRFEGPGDHARHVREGGCSAILEALAADPNDQQP